MNSPAEREKMRAAAGFTLPELLVIMVFLALGTGLAARSLMTRAERRADVEDIQGLISIASRRSLVESKHYGVHLDTNLLTFGLFHDEGHDNSFNDTDTLMSVIKLDPLCKIRMVNSDGLLSSDMTFKKNGTLAPEISFEVTYFGRFTDSAKFQVIAASGRVLEIN